MINRVLVFIKDELNEYLKRKTGNDNKTSLQNLTDEDGKVIIKNLGISLVSLEEEKLSRNQSLYQESKSGKLGKIQPEVNLNLNVLITANFGKSEQNYKDALKFISYTVAFFQNNSVFTSQNAPKLPTGIKRLVTELQTMSFEQQNHLWGTFGVSYMPSVLYKLKMISISDEQITAEAPPIQEVQLID